MWALITGATSGIGFSTAEKLAEKGYNIIAVGRNQEKLENVQESLRQYGVKVIAKKLDVTNSQEVEKFCKEIFEKKLFVKVLINNAGLSKGSEQLSNLSIVDMEEMIDTNIKGILYITKYISQQMIEKNEGHIINLGSIAGKQVSMNSTVYSATKAAVERLSDGLRLELVKTNIKVTCINPGMVKTNFMENKFSGDKVRAESVYEGVTYLLPEDIAEVIVLAITTPSRVQISEITVLPIHQARGGEIF